MKKLIALLYFMIGGSVLMSTLSLLGCEGKDYRFIYIMGSVTFWQEDTYQGQKEVKDSCSFPGFIIRQQLDYEILTAANFSFSGNKLYAYTTPDPDYTPVEKLTDIKVYTVNNYNANYPAGTEITAICRFYTLNNDYDNPGGDSSVTWVLEKLNDTFTDASFNGSHAIDVSLAEPPSGTREQQFRFEIRTEHKELMRKESEIIVITP